MLRMLVILDRGNIRTATVSERTALNLLLEIFFSKMA